jgi:uncharacterized protein YyaL (SSP411 family)
MTQTFAQEIEGAPEAYTFFLSTFNFLTGPSYSIVLVGDLKEKDTLEMLNALRKNYLPSTVLALKHPSKAGLGYMQIEGKATAYVCQNQTCFPPTDSLVAMLEQLGAKQEKH